MKRVSSSQLLPILLGTAIAVAGWMQGLQWRQDAGAAGAVDSVEVVALQQQVDQLAVPIPWQIVRCCASVDHSGRPRSRTMMRVTDA